MAYKSKELGIETPEPGAPPAITANLKNLAEQIDTLLRKQVTKKVELAKLKITESLEFPGGNVLSWGHISTVGTIVGGSGGYTCEHPEKGTYNINWTVPRENENYTIVATATGPDFAVAVVVAATSSAQVAILDSGGSTINRGFYFVAISVP